MTGNALLFDAGRDIRLPAPIHSACRRYKLARAHQLEQVSLKTTDRLANVVLEVYPCR